MSECLSFPTATVAKVLGGHHWAERVQASGNVPKKWSLQEVSCALPWSSVCCTPPLPPTTGHEVGKISTDTSTMSQ